MNLKATFGSESQCGFKLCICVFRHDIYDILPSFFIFQFCFCCAEKISISTEQIVTQKLSRITPVSKERKYVNPKSEGRFPCLQVSVMIKISGHTCLSLLIIRQRALVTSIRHNYSEISVLSKARSPDSMINAMLAVGVAKLGLTG